MHVLSPAHEALARAVSARAAAHGVSERLVALRAAASAPATAPAAATSAEPLPDYVSERLEEVKLLAGIPLAYLAPDPKLLPAESLQFFTIDPSWVLALRKGILSTGSPDPAFAQSYAQPGDPLPGMLMSSMLVRQYPGLSVRAWTGDIADGADPDDPASGATAVTLLRAERLTPNVLICVFATTPDLVIIEEPHGMVRVGVRRDSGGNAILALRQANGQVILNNGAPVTVQAPMRGNPADGVLDVTGLAAALDTAINALPQGTARPPSPTATSSAMALQLLLPPVRQRYERKAQP